MNMKKWADDLLNAQAKRPLPILSFPSVSLLGITVNQLTSDAELQAKGMKAASERMKNAAAAVSMMDLSVEAESFGCKIKITADEVPTVISPVAETKQQAAELKIPAVGAGRTGIYVDAIKRAKQMIDDRPVFAGIIGPFSLAGRLVGVTEAMIKCYEEPEVMHTVLKKAADFLKNYAAAFKSAGADGIVIAEPLTGLLSPELAEEFSEGYVRELIQSVKSDEFMVIYHNCGNNTVEQLSSILRVGADAYHFGNAVDLKDILQKAPEDMLIMGNIDPASVLCKGSADLVRQEVLKLMRECSGHKNFVISSGCDVPPTTPWTNIDAFFEAVDEFYNKG